MGEKKIVGLALCGSYCSYDKVFAAAGVLAEKYELIPIMSGTAAATDSRFGMAEENMRRLAELTGHADVVTTIAAAEPLGPAKAHLRNGRPLVLAISTNDGLSGSAENIARLLNRKNVYFVPFGQDDPAKKPCSLQADFSLMYASVEAAMAGAQLQPILTAK